MTDRQEQQGVSFGGPHPEPPADPAGEREPVTHQLEGEFVIDLEKLGNEGEED